MSWKLRAAPPGETGLRRELYFLSAFRVLEGGLFATAAFSPLAMGTAPPRSLAWAGAAAIAQLTLGGVLFVLSRRSRWRPRDLFATGVVLDMAVFAVLLLALPGFGNGVSLLMLFNVAAYALLTRLGWGLGLAATATLIQIGTFIAAQVFALTIERPLAEAVMFGASYMLTAMLTHLLGQQLRETQSLARQREVEVGNLERVNELIIRRMRTGLLAVDSGNTIRIFNESAWYLLGNPAPDRKALGEVAPDLLRRLWQWRQSQKADTTPLALSPDTPAVIPRFTAMGRSHDLTLIFLDDTSLLSRRAEELTLTTLGRLAASVAHEIRNPLAAISHAGQLLRESSIEPETDHRLVEIINTQCQRMDGIVQNVLGLARRERSRPETLELVAWSHHFVADFHRIQPDERDELKVSAPQGAVRATMDPQQLQQVATVLVQNALTYGRIPGEAARVTLFVHRDSPEGEPMLDVVDRGPGIPAGVAAQLFEPFFTTSEHGTGLGLYIARQLCEANQATLNHVPLPGGGSCFRITLARTEPVASAVLPERTSMLARKP